jgi:hypothetical protein
MVGTLTKKDIGMPLGKIMGSPTDFVTPDGRIFKRDKNQLYFEKKTRINKHNGYVYCGIYIGNEKNQQRRVHKLVAIVFIPNPNNLPIVGHQDNIKHHNIVNNLYWTTISANTQKAVDDGLMVNDIGIEDSQSNPLAMYKNNGEMVAAYGSISSAGRCIEGTDKSSIAKVIDKSKKGVKGYYYRSISKNDYFNISEQYREKKLKVKYIPKIQNKFKAISPDGKIYISDNQKDFARKHNLQQGGISAVLHKKHTNHFGWDFKYIV